MVYAEDDVDSPCVQHRMNRSDCIARQGNTQFILDGCKLASGVALALCSGVSELILDKLESTSVSKQKPLGKNANPSN
ncbi:hypothetical protein ALC56_08539 [Trachymyrmex septentrionalis]|uniref:Uncharacterized protein n=1 Tax=Trachymyrmex septentrionalis TaxID=34720 RepID=A0A195F8H9_9HYME|nr:hypothetical protein ALC56_08539 [Trachymyrmex septentrionalis]